MDSSLISRLRSTRRSARGAWDRLRGGYWLVPLSCVGGSVLTAFGLIALDRYLQDRDAFGWTYAGGPQNASDTLTTIASSMITFTGLVFSITVLALQLTSAQFSPRALRNFLRDRVAQFALGIFIATFSYAFAALSAVRVASDDDPSFVPGITVTGAFVLIAISLVTFVQYIHHTAQSIRAVTIVERIADETRAAIDSMYPEEFEGSDAASDPIDDDEWVQALGSRTAGVIVDVDLEAMASAACRMGVVVEVLHCVGDYVCEGEPLMRIRTLADDGATQSADECEPTVLHRAVHFATERTMLGDAAFGLRQLVDIAERALSPGTNDPTTAVQCLDRIHDLLRRLATREIPTRRTVEVEGVVRASAPSPSFADLVTLATEEIMWWGRESLQVRRRLRRLFDDLLRVTDDVARRSTLVSFAGALAEIDSTKSAIARPITDVTRW